MNKQPSSTGPSNLCSWEDFGEYRHFTFLTSGQRKFPPIKLLSKIVNRDNRKDLLSLIYYNVDNQLFGLGHNDAGCLGVGSPKTIINTPTRITLGHQKPIIKISSGFRFVIALTLDGRCYSWGDNKFGQLGVGKSMLSRNKPALIDSLQTEHVIDVCCGHSHALILTKTNDLFAFGSNLSGAVGNGTTFHQLKAVQLTAISESTSLFADIVSLSAGGWHSACVNRKGELFVWGWNQNGQCCHEDVKANQLTPRRVLIKNLDETFPSAYSVIKRVQCGLHHTLALTYDGVVFAFGSNEFGECGQDMANGKFFTSAQLVYFDEPMLEICALAKSRLSMSRSQLNFYVWGQCKQSSSNMFQPRKIAISQQIQTDLSFNVILAKHEPNQYNLDVNLLNASSTTPLMIRNCESKTRSGSLSFTFNDPNESDMALIFGPVTEPMNPNVKLIFVQKMVLENYDDFFANFPKEYINSPTECQLPLPDCIPSTIKNNPNTANKISKENLIPPPTVPQNLTLTVAHIKKRFNLLSINGLKYEVLYAYLFFTYSNYILIDEEEFVNLMQLAQMLKNQSLMSSCMQHMRTHFQLDKLCRLFKFAIEGELGLIVQFCIEQAQSMIENPKDCDYISTEKLYSQRSNADLVLTCTGENGTQSIFAHRLIMLVRSHLYQSLSNAHLRDKSAILTQLFTLNQASTMEEWLRLNNINFGNHFNEQAVQLFIQFVYCRTEPTNETIEVLVSLLKMAKVFHEHPLEGTCLERIGEKITLDNVCHFFGKYSHDSDNPFVAELCMKVASRDLGSLITCDDFRRLLAEPEQPHLQAFLASLSTYLLMHAKSI